MVISLWNAHSFARLSVTAREGTTISAGAGQTEISGFR
jgi:hypothetical protein